ncbi:unannotated protein [freshwater metagenome]|uniref:Unannotated protein n=1 Tax=freshwater metagenome TaxID=449393 RepID=A0A6J7GVM6_9ZZZZ
MTATRAAVPTNAIHMLGTEFHRLTPSATRLTPS